MSQYYRMSVNISDVPVELVEEIKEAALTLWNFDWCSGTVVKGKRAKKVCDIQGSGEGSLSGGESNFVDKLCEIVWEIAKQPLGIDVDAVYLENLPYQTYSRYETDYISWLVDKAEKEWRNSSTKLEIPSQNVQEWLKENGKACNTPGSFSESFAASSNWYVVLASSTCSQENWMSAMVAFDVDSLGHAKKCVKSFKDMIKDHAAYSSKTEPKFIADIKWYKVSKFLLLPYCDVPVV